MRWHAYAVGSFSRAFDVQHVRAKTTIGTMPGGRRDPQRSQRGAAWQYVAILCAGLAPPAGRAMKKPCALRYSAQRAAPRPLPAHPAPDCIGVILIPSCIDADPATTRLCRAMKELATRSTAMTTSSTASPDLPMDMVIFGG